jgi:drug/metabolite transporter (DMT)-like permease
LQQIRPPEYSDFAKLSALAAMWASAFLCIEIALVDFSPLAIVAWRICLGTLVLAPIAFARGEPLPRGARTWALIAIAGVLYNAIPFSLISWGQQYIPSGTAAILMSCGPFAALVLSHFLTRDDRFSLNKFVGVVLGFSGVVVLVGFEAAGGSARAVGGQLAMVVAVSCYALSSLVIRRIDGVSPLMISAAVLATSCTYVLPILIAAGEPFPEISQQASVAALAWLGVVPTALAYILRVQIAREVGATFLAQVSYLIPPFGLFLSWLFLDQVPPTSSVLALALILGGLGVSRLAPARTRPAS